MSSEMKISSILDHVPVEDTIHKENTIKPGPWNSGSKRCPLMISSTKLAFKGIILFTKKIYLYIIYLYEKFLFLLSILLFT